MKTVLIVFALCLAAARGELGVQQLDDDSSNAAEVAEQRLVHSLVALTVHEAEHLANDILLMLEHEVKHELESLVLQPVYEVQYAVVGIETRKEESEACVAAEEQHVAVTVSNAYIDHYKCIRDATTSSVQLVIDTAKAVKQLTVDGYAVVKQAMRCRKLKAAWRRKPCKVRLYAMLTIYIYNGQKSLRTLIGLRKSGPAIVRNARRCTHDAVQRALTEFGAVNANIDQCVFNALH